MHSLTEIGRLKRMHSEAIESGIEDQETRELIEKKQTKELFKAMKQIDRVNECAPKNM